MHVIHVEPLRRRRVRDALHQPARPENGEAVDGEAAAEERPVGIEEARDSTDGQAVLGIRPALISQYRRDERDLLLHAFDELRAVAPSDAQTLHARTDDAACNLESSWLIKVVMPNLDCLVRYSGASLSTQSA